MIELELINGQTAQVGQRRIARAEIIERHRHAHGAQLRQLARHVVHVIECGVFGDLQIQLARKHVGIAREVREYPFGEFAVPQPLGIDVDADLHVDALALQAGDLGERRIHQPVGELGFQLGAVDDMQKRSRQHHAVLGMHPAHQCLGAHHGAALQVDLGLQIQ
ncbi:hypothetical protein SDC9_165808 [bioreactor metagenome]|uniref:Uncharacterized protein n=1 Tax=bioreactor metagenome TaxID=1076179 RepID=A0A645FV95_9ZZZZ